MKLPQQLQSNEFRFVLIKKGTKCPYEEKWQTTNNYTFFNKKIELIENTGIVCGYGNLIVLDIDKKELLEEFDNKCNTFSVKTGSGKRHYYFICKEEFDRSYYVLSGTVGELRVKNSQVLTPGSSHPNGNKYEVYNDKEIREISKEELRSLLGSLFSKDSTVKDTTRSGKEWSEVCSMVDGRYCFEDIDEEMILLGYERWKTRTMEDKLSIYYKVLQCKKLNKSKDL